MNKAKRSKTEPASPEMSPLTWSLVSTILRESPERGSSVSVTLPPVERPQLNEEEKETVNLRVLKMMRNGYNPIGCSKSIKLERVRLRKKMNQKSMTM